MNTRNQTVLVVSDSHEQFSSTASLLRDQGFDVRFDTGSRDISSLADGELPNLIISELASPNVDGLQLCRSVRDEQKLRTTRVLLVGELSRQSSIVNDGFRCGAAAYAQKPIDPRKLVSLCRSLLLSDQDASIGATPKPRSGRSCNVSVSVPIKTRPEARFDKVIANDILRTLIFEKANLGLALFSSTGRFLECNPALMQLLDYSESQLLDLTIFDFINPYNLKGDLESLVAVVRSDTDYCKFQNGYLTARGDRVWGQLTIVRIPANEPDSHFLIGVFDDPANHNFDAPALRSDNLAALGDKSWEIDKGLIGVN